MPERPVILFPSPEKADRNSKRAFYKKINKPHFSEQYNRLAPSFSVLQEAFRQKNILIQRSATGINPDFALVFEIVGSVESFYTAVQHCEGLEWMFDIDSEDITPDDDFYEIINGNRSESSLNGKLYCVMSNQQALEQVLSLWRRYKDGENDVFQRGFAGLRDVFINIKTIRKWDATDRFAETGIIDQWRKDLEMDGDQSAPFEIELFYRVDGDKQRTASQTVKQSIIELGGDVINECVMPEILYHAILAKLPRNVIERLIEEYDSIQLSHVDDIMFFRPSSQSANISLIDTEKMSNTQNAIVELNEVPIAAILDGMPVQNHPLLRNKVIIDDPDDYAANYEANQRIHGSGMASLIIYGDLSKDEEPVKHKVYVRPIFQPKETGIDTINECIPDNVLFVDVLHRAIRRMKEGENGEPPTAPDVQIVNLSLGDPARQLSNAMSPIARMIDYLAYKYKLLFIISAGNHPEVLDSIQSSFQDLRARTITQRNHVFWSAMKDNQRNLRLLSPAESINGLTIGATYNDFSNANETDRRIWAVEQGMPSPISAIGKGYRGIIAPDLLYYGGRKFIAESYTTPIKWILSNRAPGCKVAAPYNDGTDAGQRYSFGTSDSTALITHEAINCYDVLTQIFYDEVESVIPRGYEAILLKGMLTHSASWESFAEELSRVTGDGIKQLSKWAGYGVPCIERVKECTKERITLIGYGKLTKDQADVFRLPLHLDFSSRLVKRKLTVTLSYFSSIVADKQAYRSTQLWFEVDDGGKNLIPAGSRKNSEWQAVRKGTLQHEIYIGEQPIVWNDDDLIIKVNCKEDAGKLKTEAIPYCIFVSFEVAEGLDIDLYASIKTQIHQRISIQQ